MVLIHCLTRSMVYSVGLKLMIDYPLPRTSVTNSKRERKASISRFMYMSVSPHIHSICARVVFISMFVNRKPCGYYPRALSFLRSRCPLSALLASSFVSTRRPESSIRILEMVHEFHVIKTRQTISDGSTYRVSSAMSVWSLTRK